jgi:hypothetical protein
MHWNSRKRIARQEEYFKQFNMLCGIRGIDPEIFEFLGGPGFRSRLAE